MKERILGQLNGICTSDPDSGPYLNKLKEELQLSEEEIRSKAEQALTLMIHDYSRFRVETIDSFFQSVMRNLARELELGANLNIELDHSMALSEAVDSMIEKLDRQSPVLYWLLDYIEERIQDDKQWKVADEIKSFGRNIFNEEYIEKGQLLRKTLQDKDCIRNYQQVLKTLEREAVEQMKGFADQFFGILDSYQLSVSDFSYKESGVAGYFIKLRDGITINKIRGTRVTNCMGDPGKWASQNHDRYDEIVLLAQNELIPLLETAEEFRVKNNRIINSCQLSLRYINNVRLLHHIDEEVRLLNQEKNRFLLSDTNALLHSIIREGDPSFVFEKIGTNIRNVMIDEFQDTSRMQWGNFKLLLMEGLSQGADSLIVGDVKQSIYRWRNGDWTILNKLKKQIGPFPIKELTLKTNRRSEANIIRFNNEIFTSACQILDSKYQQEWGETCDELKHAYKDVEQENCRKEEKGSVKLTFLTNKDDRSYSEDTLQQLAAEVERMVEEGVKVNDMAILVRKNHQIPVIADYFDKFTSYRIVSDEAFRLDASLAICMLMDALRYLVDPQNRIAQAQLAAAYQNEVLHREVDLNTLLLGNLDDFLPTGFIENQNSLRLMPLFELLEKLSILFQLSEIESQDAYLFAFYDRVNEYLQQESSELTAFITHWEERLCYQTIPSGELEGIRILSIHKSKGLEFHTVFLPFCDWKLENERNFYVWCSPNETPFDQLQLLPINYGSSMNESIYQSEYQKEKIQLWVDNLNLLYVAFTRPKCNLRIWCKDEQKGTVSELLAASIVATTCQTMEDKDNCTYQLGETAPSEAKQKKVTTNKLLVQPEGIPVRMEWLDTTIEFRQSNRSANFIEGEEEDGNPYIRQGQIMHSLFAMVRTHQDVNPAIDRLRMEGIIESDAHEKQVRKLTDWALGHPKVKEWFSGSWELYNECAILYRDKGEVQTRRPDRVMMKDGEVVVVDFKFGKPYPEYEQQVREYMDLLQHMGYTQIRGYLWYVFNNQLIEIG